MHSDPFIIIKNFRQQVESPLDRSQIIDSKISYPQKI